MSDTVEILRRRVENRDYEARPDLVAAWLRQGSFPEPRIVARLRQATVNAAAFIDEQRIVIGGGERPVKLWAAEKGKLTAADTIYRESDYGSTGAVFIDGDWLVTSPEIGSAAWRLHAICRSGATVTFQRPAKWSRRGMPGKVQSGDGHLVVATSEAPAKKPRRGPAFRCGLIQVYALPTDPKAPAPLIQEFRRGPGEAIVAAGPCPGELVAFRQKGKAMIEFFDVGTGELTATRQLPDPEGHFAREASEFDPHAQARTTHTTFRADPIRRRIWVGLPQRLLAWDLDDQGQPTEDPVVHLETPAGVLAISPGGSFLVTGQFQKSHVSQPEVPARLWWIPPDGGPRPILQMEGGEAAAFSPSGTQLLLGFGPQDAKATLWRLLDAALCPDD